MSPSERAEVRITVTMLLTTSKGGARSAAHYAQVDAASMGTREVMQAFEKMAFDERKPVEAFAAFVAPNFVDHDPDVRGDRASVLQRLKGLDWNTGRPERTIKHMIVDGDMVAVHHHLIRKSGERGIAAVDLFRVKDGKLVEHWNVMQAVPATSINPNAMF